MVDPPNASFEGVRRLAARLFAAEDPVRESAFVWLCADPVFADRRPTGRPAHVPAATGSRTGRQGHQLRYQH